MTYNFKEVSVLIVESSPPVFELLRGVLSMLGVPSHNIDPAYDIDQGFRMFCEKGHDMLVIDWLDTPDRGVQLIKRIRTNTTPNPFVPILMTAGSGHKQRVVKARDAGVSDYLVKPFTARQLATKIETIVEKPRPFVVCPSYTGPNRRIRELPFMGADKRIDAPVLKQLGSGGRVSTSA